MDGNHRFSTNIGSSANEESFDATANMLSIEQLQRLVRLIDRSDVSELELKHAGEGTRLVLRKAKVSESYGQHEGVALPQRLDASVASQKVAPNAPPAETKHHISAHLVGIFH